MPKELEERLIEIHELVTEGLYEKALPKLEDILEDYPNHSGALNMAGYCWAELGKDATSYQFFQRALQTEPNNYWVLVNCGRSLHEVGKYEEAITYFLKAAEIDPTQPSAFSNASASLVQLSKWEDGLKAAELALECDNEDGNARRNISNCNLALGDLERGWEAYELTLGTKYRKEWVYGEEARWNGEKNKNVVVYGEQGLGDEIYFCDSIPDLINDCKEVHIDCDPRLKNLYQRSFPDAHVHGTRRDDIVDWLDDTHIDYRVSMGSLPKFYRNKKEDYPRKPYLKADPDKVFMWRSLFESWGKPVIGLCSVSGTKRNNQSGRTITEDDWKPFVEKHDAVYISLDYKGDDPSFCKTYHSVTRAYDYDDMAALVSALDGVVGVCTTALHLADAVGTKAIHLAPTQYNWKFAGGIPFAETAKVIHQDGKSWKEVLANVDLP